MKAVGWFGLGALAGLIVVGSAIAVSEQGRRLKLAEQRATIHLKATRDSTRYAMIAEQAKAVTDSLERARASQDVVIANAERTTARLRQQVLIARRAIQDSAATLHSVPDTGANVPDLGAVVAVQDSLIAALTTENTGLRVALGTETLRGSQLSLALAAADSALAAERVRAGALDALVRARLPAPPGKLLGFLPKPSRGLMFVAGLALGVAATR